MEVGYSPLLYIYIINSWWHDVFAYTLLHRELRDYSFGQIAFAVFGALFVIKQLLCHLSSLLTSACKQEQLLRKRL